MNDDFSKPAEETNKAPQTHDDIPKLTDAIANSEPGDAAMKLPEQIDASLQRSFAITQTERQSLAGSIQSMLDASAYQQSATTKTVEHSLAARIAQSRLFKIALVASLLLAIGVSIFRISGPNSVEPYFSQQSLAMVFHDSVSRGFQPYYNCEDMRRFADTFEARQGQRLVLAPMPAGTKMLGLSYLGGISRDTTAMLATVDTEKVIVFVDALHSWATLDTVTARYDKHPELNMFVVRKHGLVFVEVSTLDSARVIQYIVPE